MAEGEKVMKRYFVATIMSLLLISVNASGSIIDAALDSQVIAEVPDIVNKGDTFQVLVSAEGMEDLAGFQIDLQYTASLVKCMDGMVKGVFLGSSVYWIDPVIDNAVGTATGVLCVRTRSGGVDGTGQLFSLTFKAIASGTASFVLKNVLMLNSNVEEIPVSIIGGYAEIRAYPNWDVNQDGRVNVADLLIVALALNDYVSGQPSPNPDVDRSGRVTVADLVLVAQHYGESYINAAPGKDYRLMPADILVLRATGEEVADDTVTDLIDRLLLGSQLPKAALWGDIKCSGMNTY